MLRRTLGSPGGCWPKDAQKRLWNGRSEPENWIRLRLLVPILPGFCFPHVATMKPFGNCTQLWQCDRMMLLPIGSLDSLLSGKENLRMPSRHLSEPFPSVIEAPA